MSTPPEPKPSAPALVIERDEDFSFVLECIEALATSTDYTERILAIAGHHAVDRIKVRLTTLTAERDAAWGERDALAAEYKKSQAALLAMMNTNQARAQSAAQATAKIAQELQIYLKEHAPDMV